MKEETEKPKAKLPIASVTFHTGIAVGTSGTRDTVTDTMARLTENAQGILVEWESNVGKGWKMHTIRKPWAEVRQVLYESMPVRLCNIYGHHNSPCRLCGAVTDEPKA